MNNETKFSFDPENKIVTNNETGSTFKVEENRNGFKVISVESNNIIQLEGRPTVIVNGIFY